jgi:hypothetical protein
VPADTAVEATRMDWAGHLIPMAGMVAVGVSSSRSAGSDASVMPPIQWMNQGDKPVAVG